MSKLASKAFEVSSIQRWPTTTARVWVEGYLGRASSDPKILAVLGVGSTVRNGVHSKDIDLVTIVNNGAESVQENAPLEVDLRPFSASEIETRILNGHDYLGWAVKFGVVLHQKNEFWTKLVAKLEGKVPLPSAQIARERANRARNYAQSLLEVGDEDAALEQIISLLTHLGRAELIEAGVYPASRPEIPRQLEEVGRPLLAGLLSRAIRGVSAANGLLKELEEVAPIERS